MQKKVAGRYALPNVDHINRVALLLNDDGSFVVTFFGDIVGEVTDSGKWVKKGDTIAFARKKSGDSVATVVSKYEPGLKERRFELRRRKDSSLIFDSQLFGDGKELTKVSEGVFTSSFFPKHLKMEYLNTPTNIPAVNINLNSFVVYFDFSKRHIVYLMDSLFVFKGDTLISKTHPRLKFVRSKR
jgi:hypothetical protein